MMKNMKNGAGAPRGRIFMLLGSFRGISIFDAFSGRPEVGQKSIKSGILAPTCRAFPVFGAGPAECAVPPGR